MKAIVQPRYGPPDVLVLRDDADLLALADDAVLVRVRAASVNAGDWRQVRASPFLIRLDRGLRRPRAGGLGVDAAGHVEAVGNSVTDLHIGDAVFGMVRNGAFAEYVSGGWFVQKPEGLTFEQAAAVPAAGCTALRALRDRGKIQAGQRVLVNGAGGGVGTFAVQIAKAYGADVTAVTRTANLDLVRSIGADHVIDHAREDFTEGGQAYDLIVDVGGTTRLSACRRALARDGTLVLVGAGKGPGGPVARMLAGHLRSRFLKQRVVAFIASAAGFEENLLALKGLIEAGNVMPVTDRIYPLAETAEAIRYLETGHARGKVVITV